VEPSQLADGKLFDFLSLGLREDAPLAQVHAPAWLGGEALVARDGDTI